MSIKFELFVPLFFFVPMHLSTHLSLHFLEWFRYTLNEHLVIVTPIMQGFHVGVLHRLKRDTGGILRSRSLSGVQGPRYCRHSTA